MNITKKQMGTIFVAFIFFGSSFAFAMNWVLPSEQKQENRLPNVFEQPLSDSQISYFLDKDISILFLFYSDDNKDSVNQKNIAENIANTMKDRLVIEEINVREYQSVSAYYNVRYVPTIIIKGEGNLNEPIRFDNLVTESDLKNSICSSYKEKPAVCG
ncbi:MAG: hypothetical protein J7L08_01355 [Candidatus Aenigmarchaeota archaeon]|nr:hypothetical protein [Candidatus Aenigmarchaeota archaeon]